LFEQALDFELSFGGTANARPSNCINLFVALALCARIADLTSTKPVQRKNSVDQKEILEPVAKTAIPMHSPGKPRRVNHKH
jgi:hypothetical protein